MQILSLSQENPLKEGMGTHTSILALRISWTEEPRGLWSIGSQSRAQLKRLSTHAFIVISYDPLCFCDVDCSIFFISDLGILSFFLDESG